MLKSRTFHWNGNACALGEPREGSRNRESVKVLKCKGHKIYLKVKYESSGASIGCNQTRSSRGPFHPSCIHCVSMGLATSLCLSCSPHENIPSRCQKPIFPLFLLVKIIADNLIN